MTEKNSLTVQARTRVQIATFLPAAIEKAVESYRAHMERGESGYKNPSADTKSSDVEKAAAAFVALHKDAKVALAHIELLIKLAKWADLPDATLESAAETQRIEDLLAAAQAELDGENGQR